jgi:hypothetical protein
MKPLVNARILSGTVVDLADFALENGYKLQSDHRGYLTFVPLKKSYYSKTHYKNVVQLHQR